MAPSAADTPSSSTQGPTRAGPPHGAATLGTAAAVTGRKNKGAAVINITLGNGAAQTYNVTPENANLRAANQYVNAFNALAAQLEAEATQ
ncbi:hypothetical protein ABZ341_35245 [Streptomyces sp. NPDC006173]|uniref:hypothetical protein n=1 Tax=Streptomyces sp. NPDC006173 TaxID=3155349 RepID=UPI0033DCD58B